MATKNIKKINEYLEEEGNSIKVRGKWYEYEIKNFNGDLIQFNCKLSKSIMFDLIVEKSIKIFLENENVEVVGDGVVLDEVPEEERPDIFADMSTIEAYLDIVLSDKIEFKNMNSLIVGGPTSIGKSEKIDRILKEKNVPYFMVKGYSTAFGLFNFLKNHSNDLIVFDDTDSIWQDVTALNVLKAALDSKHERHIHWNSGDDEDSFIFTGKIIFISNINFYKQKSKMPHIAAVLSRILFVQVTDEREQMLLYIKSIAEEMEASKQTRDFVSNYLDTIKASVDLRLFLKLAAIAKYCEFDQNKFEILSRSVVKAQRLK